MRNILVLVFVSALLSACATPMHMAVDKKSTTVESDSHATLILATTMKNVNKEKYQPKPWILYITNEVNKSQKDRFNFIMDKDGKIENGKETVYLYRASLVPGTYYIRSVSGQVRKGLVFGTAALPVNQTIKLEKPGFYYLGRVDGVIRARKDDKEFRAGPPIPLIDQSVSGLSNGTWEIKIYDNSATDLKLVRANYPALKTVQIENMILAPFDREMIQKKWDTDKYQY